MPNNKERNKIEKITYNSFKALGYISVLFVFGGALIATGTPPGVIGFSIFLPATVIAIPATILGPGLSFFIWHNRHLNYMKALTVFIIIALLIFQNFEWVVLLLFTVFGIVCISIDRHSKYL